MHYLEIINVAVKSLVKNKVRSLLTMLGIIIGVAAVITMLAIGEGAKKLVDSEIDSMGTNVITVVSNWSSRSVVRQEAGSGNSIKLEDIEAIRNQVQGVNYISPVIQTFGRLRAGSRNWRTVAYGVNAEYFFIRNYDVSDGTFFSPTQIQAGAKVMVLGKTVADYLFPDGGAVGQRITIRNVPVEIVGVLTEKGQSAVGGDLDNVVLIPYTTALARLRGWREPMISINVSATSKGLIPVVRQEILQLLLLRNKTLTEDSFIVNSQTDLADMANNVSSTITLLLSSIAGISLVVGGIGIMNIMLVSVTERIKEIGLRMAVGAKKKDVLRQFIFEAIFLSGLGGVIGIILGSVVAKIVGNMMNWSVEITTWSVLLSFSFSAIIGVFFGWYPARKAANLNLIDALRYE